MIRHNNLKPDNETFRSMISLSVKMKDVSVLLFHLVNLHILLNYLKHVSFIHFFLCSSLQFEGAYNMINDLEKMNLIPTANMYNAIMTGCFREVSFSISLML